MKAFNLKITAILFVFVNGFLFAQTKLENERLEIIGQFIRAFKQDSLSNATIMKIYVVEGGYFKKDSVRNWADFYLDETRRTLKLTSEQNIFIQKYLGNENKYSVTDIPIGQSERTRKLEFILYQNITSVNPKENKIDINDLYIVEIKYKGEYDVTENGKLFILFNEQNKILAFADFRMNNHVALYQF
jgi:hypothetical protein